MRHYVHVRLRVHTSDSRGEYQLHSSWRGWRDQVSKFLQQEASLKLASVDSIGFWQISSQPLWWCRKSSSSQWWFHGLLGWYWCWTVLIMDPHVHLCFTLLIRHISHYMVHKIYFNQWVKWKNSLGICFLCIFTPVILSIPSIKQQRCNQKESFSPRVTTSAPNPLVSCILILSLQRLLHAASKSLTQLSVVTRHVSPDLWHTASRKALQDDWSSSQKVLEERFNFQRAHHFRFHIAVFMHWTAFVVLILHCCPS